MNTVRAAWWFESLIAPYRIYICVCVYIYKYAQVDIALANNPEVMCPV